MIKNGPTKRPGTSRHMNTFSDPDWECVRKSRSSTLDQTDWQMMAGKGIGEWCRPGNVISVCFAAPGSTHIVGPISRGPRTSCPIGLRRAQPSTGWSYEAIALARRDLR